MQGSFDTTSRLTIKFPYLSFLLLISCIHYSKLYPLSIAYTLSYSHWKFSGIFYLISNLRAPNYLFHFISINPLYKDFIRKQSRIRNPRSLFQTHYNYYISIILTANAMCQMLKIALNILVI